METQDRAKGVIQSVLKERFRDVEIVSVDIDDDFDEDGDSLLMITVVFNSATETLDPGETSSLTRRLLPKLAEIGEKAFPIVSFVAESELRRSRSGAGRSARNG